MRTNNTQKRCEDVFHAYLLRNVQYAGENDFPVIRSSQDIPRKMIPFSKALREKKDYHQWICFYENDQQFERIWNNPTKYLHILKKFDGVITPDFSVYCNMPYSMQIWNIFRSRALGAWLQKQGIKVIPNIRFGDTRTFECCCDGISKNSVIAIGSLGCIKSKVYRDTFEAGVNYVVKRLRPRTLIIYGCPPKNVNEIKKQGVNVVIIKPLSFYDQEGKVWEEE